LFDAPAVSGYGIAVDSIGHRFTSRIDLADCLLRQALCDAHVRSTIAVATVGAHPSILKLIWREGIRKRP
ncbi:MAG TPA: NAD(P)-dependent oxidoreductase, partial [Actinomycetota bacterium]|nr:NAD(P)-dependent oxidoreductase [Actinomycetota bacterium]